MKKHRIYLFLIIIIQYSEISCHKENIITDSLGVIIKLPPLWVSSVTNNGVLAANGLYGSVVYNNNTLVYIRENGIRNDFSSATDYITFKSLEDGKEQWRWNDKFRPNDYFYLFYHYQYDNYFIYAEGSKNYCIDLSTGKTVWRKQDMGQYDNRITGLNNIFFLAADSTKNIIFTEYSVYQSDVKTGDKRFIVTPPYISAYKGAATSSSIYHVCHPVAPFIQGTDTLLSIPYQEIVKPNNPVYNNSGLIQCYLGLYNMTQKKWIYSGIPFTDPGVSETMDNLPIIDNGLVYHSINYTMFCHDLMTGKEIWRRPCQGNFLFGGFLVYKGNVMANSESDYLYALDGKTGEILWKVKSPGTCTQIQELNGVLYYVGGGDGNLYAVDAENGKVYWKFKSPDLATRSDAYFYGVCSVAPGSFGKKGKVVVSSGLNAFCYEAVK